MLKPLFLSALFTALSCSSTHQSNLGQCLRTRAGIDIGSGSTKLKVYQVNTCNQTIIKEVDPNKCSYSDKVAYKESLKNNNQITKTILEEGLAVLNKMKHTAANCGANEFSATATSAFRQADNAKAAIQYLEKSGIKIHIISQEQEAILGYNGGLSKSEDKSLCVWDIGGSSMQIICPSKNEQYHLYLGHLASVPFKDHINQLKKSKRNSPNPISPETFNQSLKRTRLEASSINKSIPSDFFKDKKVIGIGGVHYYAVSQAIQSPHFDSKTLNKHILSRLNKTDQELGGGKYVNTAVSNMILVYGIMKELGISQVIAKKVNLTEGLVVSPKYWD